MNLTKIYQELKRLIQDGQNLDQYLRESVERDPVLPFLTVDVASLRRHFLGIRAQDLLDRLEAARHDPNESSRGWRQDQAVERALQDLTRDMIRGRALEDQSLSALGKLMLYASEVEFYKLISDLAQEKPE